MEMAFDDGCDVSGCQRASWLLVFVVKGGGFAATIVRAAIGAEEAQAGDLSGRVSEIAVASEVGSSLTVGAVLTGQRPANVEQGAAVCLKVWDEVCHWEEGYSKLKMMEYKTPKKKML